MLNEVVELLNIKAGASIIDATLNGGGHTEEILEKYPDVKVLGIEWDPDIVENLKLKIKNGKSDNFRERLIIINDSYVDLRAVVEKYNFQPDGIIFDLGLSSWHYEKSGRGFSFMRDEPLDMRFNPNETVKTAADILNTAPEVELEEIIRLYGEEDFAEDIAKRIVTARKSKPIVGTQDLVAVIMDSVPGWYKKRKIHPATKTFQALRVAVNGELDNVEKGVIAAIEVLKLGGRLVVISFQGLEDKIVREIFKNKSKTGEVKWVKKGTIKPKWEEVKRNPRARSAKMKVIEKL
ncbi:MAG: 16S rRNA (cytosine(1402)-N(4))-methyltransferase [Candidatus Yanofskybacteria bacterium RIFCSPHIGHO2_02_FULL_44_12b]|uniref:Ribosomal RNA small subunit methyltransferase H n=2 Tax=Candidatus Yanofskyibacteriota TaxID=1752733 RepID=A0A1F8GJI2_9BACT|nr:MAG: Ribosomal RNA small subunit methyltransferase H [Candidatus Yanofskybacteria bacterium GW2011_GWA2_44_9]OGN05128.1 MAG: 16S rRNA (cytosine(1402)-N(4))-methyltransferase [Candidatus Yanofskybacteria bacterium RIFCSPHIGHO2_01_FULL_44_24]OGN15983.1 MAG: 16S rRNA (cytosine(1402)-N(4))-methyltransferase [Candidatus Yanofskybacteria bacterium RIFCSPHIGHO2_02_FULL_44_12b]OGN25493.1 MAG: 16S rRNA (cytosine(1402)-N(4))-methyltransferase [Candidatus Yanofskybacteria bacterium RIFCSPLOWO2_01_FULL_4